MNRLAEVHAIDEELERRRDQFRETFARFAHENACGLHYVAIPTTSIDLGRVVKRHEFYAKEITVEVFRDGNLVEEMRWRFGEFHNGRPALRAVEAIEHRENLETRFSLTSGGLCEFNVLGGQARPRFVLRALVRVEHGLDAKLDRPHTPGRWVR